MKYFGEGLSEIHKELNKNIRKAHMLDQSKSLFLKLHEKLHTSTISGSEPNEVDGILSSLKLPEYRMMPSPDDETIAWVFWHITRIEDITMNILVAGRNQLFDEQWKKRINSPVTDTGNALLDDEIMRLSRQINIPELLAYRDAVGKGTRSIVQDLTEKDMRRQISPESLQKVKLVGGVTEEAESIGLLQYWGKKDVAGLLLMPPTRHVMLHLNDCCKWQQQIRSGKNVFRQV